MVDDTPIGRLVAKLAKKHKGDEAKAFSEFQKLALGDPKLSELIAKKVFEDAELEDEGAAKLIDEVLDEHKQRKGRH